MDLGELWAIFGPAVSGALFGAGWWFWIDAVVCSDVAVSFLHYLPGIFASLAALMFNCVRREDIDYSPYEEGEWRLKLWLFLAYVVSFVSLAASVGLLIQDALVTTGPSAWTGTAGVLQCVLVLIRSSLHFSFSSISLTHRSLPSVYIFLSLLSPTKMEVADQRWRRRQRCGGGDKDGKVATARGNRQGLQRSLSLSLSLCPLIEWYSNEADRLVSIGTDGEGHLTVEKTCRRRERQCAKWVDLLDFSFIRISHLCVGLAADGTNRWNFSFICLCG